MIGTDTRQKDKLCHTGIIVGPPAPVPPIVSSPLIVTASELSPFDFEIILVQGSSFGGCTMIYKLLVGPEWLTIPVQTVGLISGMPPEDSRGVYDMTFMAQNCMGTDTKNVKLIVGPNTGEGIRTARWGRSTLNNLDAEQIQALPHSDLRTKVDARGYPMDSGTPDEFIFIFIANSIGNPGDRNMGRGFNTGFTQAAMSMEEDLFPLIINNWNYSTQVVNGVTGKLFRSLFGSAGDQTWTIIV